MRVLSDEPVGDFLISHRASHGEDDTPEIATQRIVPALKGEVALLEQPCDTEQFGTLRDLRRLKSEVGGGRESREEGALEGELVHTGRLGPALLRTSVNTASAISSIPAEPVFHTASYPVGSSMLDPNRTL